MEKELYKFPEIAQFRNVITEVKHRTRFIGKDENGEPIFDETIPLPTIKYRGTVKLHGTNSGLICVPDSNGKYSFYCQSRERILTPKSDNMGFASFIHTRPVLDLLKFIPEEYFNNGELPVIKVYAEWVGKGIQSKVGISKVDKRMVIFGAKINDTWITDDLLIKFKLPEHNIYNILDYVTYNIDIDFNNPIEAAEKMGRLVEDVEKECPVAKAFGIEGIGEGIVFVPLDTNWLNGRFFFKVKGSEHENKSSDRKDKVPVDIEKVNSIKEFVGEYVCENRLKQGLDKLYENNLKLEIKNIGAFLKWVYNDIVKEELDTMMASGIEPKEISSQVSNKARIWYISKLDELAGI